MARKTVSSIRKKAAKQQGQKVRKVASLKKGSGRIERTTPIPVPDPISANRKKVPGNQPEPSFTGTGIRRMTLVPANQDPDTDRTVLVTSDDPQHQGQETVIGFDGTPIGTGEKVKTSLLIDHTVLARSKESARAIGLSFNAYATLALFNLNASFTTATQSAASFLSRGAARHSPLSKFGSGLYVPGDTDAEGVTVPWDDVERYARYQGDHPKAHYHEIGRALGLSPSNSRAADLAVETDEFKKYVAAKYGRG